MIGCTNMRRKNKGAALVEFILIIPVLLILWLGLYKLNSLYVIKQKMAVAARYGAWTNRDIMEGARVEEEMLKDLSRSSLVKTENCAILGLSKEIKPIYRDIESVVGVKYRTDILYFPAPLLMEETFSLGHNSWMAAPKKKRALDLLKDKTKPKWQDIFFP